MMKTSTIFINSKVSKENIESSVFEDPLSQLCQYISINEQMIGTKSVVGFIQYMPKKPQICGINV